MCGFRKGAGLKSCSPFLYLCLMSRIEILKRRMERVQQMVMPHKEAKKDNLILTIQIELCCAIFTENLQRMFNPLPKMPKFKTGGFVKGNASEFILNDIRGINYGEPESESDFIKRKLIYAERNRNLN